MTEKDLPPLEDDVRALLQSASAVEAAPTGVRERVLAVVDPLVGPPDPRGGGQAGGAPSSSHRPVPSTSLARRWVPLAASFALGGVTGAAAMRAAMWAGKPSPPQVVHVERPAAASAAEHQAAAPTAEPARAPLALPVPLPARPSPGQPQRPVIASSQLAAERILLDGARGALQREDPAAALEAAEQHARAYPTGILAQEREAMAIRALVMLGRTPEAQARTDLFRSRFPDSLLQPTLDSTVEAGGP